MILTRRKGQNRREKALRAKPWSILMAVDRPRTTRRRSRAVIVLRGLKGEWARGRNWER